MFKKWYKEGSALLSEIAASSPAPSELYVWNIGQCGFVFKKKAIVYIDPVLNDLQDNGVSRKYYDIPFAPSLVKADYVLCTHNHADHMALETVCGIAAADPRTRFIVPGDCILEMTAAGIDPGRIIEAHAKEWIHLPGLSVFPVQAAHPVHQMTAAGGEMALSYLLDLDGTRLLHMGDTYLTDQLFSDLKAYCYKPDIFFSPINGGDYFRTARNCIGNLSAIETARLAVELSAKLTVPTHYDMVMDNTVDPCDFIHELYKLDTAAAFRLPALGECLIYKTSL